MVAMALGMVTLLALGLLVDAAVLTASRTSLSHAAGAAARAAVLACRPQMDPACAADAALRYLQANRASAELAQIDATPERVTLQAAERVTPAFAALWGGGPVRLQALGAARVP